METATLTLAVPHSGSRTSEQRQKLFESLMEATHRQAYSLAFRLTGNAVEAEDLVQEAFVRAYRFFHRYDESLPFSSWLYRILTNLYIDGVRRRGKLKTSSLDQVGPEGASTWEIADPDMGPEATVLESSFDGPIQLGLLAMNPEFRVAILMADVDGMAYEEIAETMQTSVGTVRSRIHRGRKQLREYLLRYFPEQYAEEANS
jgi:RNA polymerase sigma-70 factor (ECF subfamily)